jgi:predicted HicB family RNase H-like nuclease
MKKYSVRMSFTVPKETKARMKAKAAAQGISMSELIRRATSVDDFGMSTQ